MYDVFHGIWILGCVLAVFGALAFAAAAGEALLRKRWRRAGRMAAIAGLFWGAMRLAALPLEAQAESDYLALIFDAYANLKRPVFEYDSGRTIHGDGYSLSVYEIPQAIRQRFEAADERLRTFFPQRSEHREHWRAEGWREAPLDPAARKYIDFALCAYDEDQSSRLTAEYADIRDALTRRRTYYGFLVYDHGETPGNVDLFIVDLERDRLYMINHNT